MTTSVKVFYKEKNNMSFTKWGHEQVASIYEQPFLQLLKAAIDAHNQFFSAGEVELCTLLSIKTGGCPEDCGYCSQSAHFKTDLKREKLMDLDEVIRKATLAKENGAIRFCMGAAWRSPPKKELGKVITMIKAVKEIGLETCVTLGMLDEEDARKLQEAGLDYYNHNLDTSAEYYQKVTTTRTYQDRLDTLEHVKNVGIKVCCGGIIGLGESRRDRILLLMQLANLKEPPKSIPINRLMPIPGTPIGEKVKDSFDPFEFIRTIATARILMPQSIIRLSAGRAFMSDEMQTLCFLAGANSMWLGDTLLTTPNPDTNKDMALLDKLGLKSAASSICPTVTQNV
jgi:biotin synthase